MTDAPRDDLDGYASKALQIHAAVFDRLNGSPAFDQFNIQTYRRTPMRKYQADQLPALSVFLRDDDGRNPEPVAGEPWFDHDLTIAVQILLQDSDDDDLYMAMEQANANALRLLLNDPSFNATYSKLGPPNIHGGAPRMTTRRLFTTAQASEVPLAQIVTELHFAYRWDWPPVLPDDLKVIHVESRYPAGADPAVQQVVREYDIPQE